MASAANGWFRANRMSAFRQVSCGSGERRLCVFRSQPTFSEADFRVWAPALEQNVPQLRSVTAPSPRARTFRRVLVTAHSRCRSSLLMFPKFMTSPKKNGYRIVIAGQTRNPVVAEHWIPDQSLPRARSGVRHDSVFLGARHELWKAQ